MTRTFAGAAILITAALLLVGCAASEPAATHTYKASATPTPSADTTTAYWAGLVAQQQSQLQDWKSDWDGNECLASETDTNVLCNATLLTGAYAVQTAYLSINGPATPDAANYAGTAPAEIQPLLSDTLTSLKTASAAAKDWQDSDCAGGGTTNVTCSVLGFKVESRMEDALSTFDRWKPYL